MILHKRFGDTVFSAGKRLRGHRAQEAPGTARPGDGAAGDRDRHAARGGAQRPCKTQRGLNQLPPASQMLVEPCGKR